MRIGWGLMTHGEIQINEGKADRVTGVMKASQALVAARDAMKNDADFGKWCSDSGFGPSVIDRNTRAALIRIGRNKDVWSARLRELESEGRTPSLRYLVKNAPDEGISVVIPPRHQTKPGPKPRTPNR